MSLLEHEEIFHGLQILQHLNLQGFEDHGKNCFILTRPIFYLNRNFDFRDLKPLHSLSTWQTQCKPERCNSYNIEKTQLSRSKLNIIYRPRKPQDKNMWSAFKVPHITHLTWHYIANSLHSDRAISQAVISVLLNAEAWIGTQDNSSAILVEKVTLRNQCSI
jgi:hypothetical protein